MIAASLLASLTELENGEHRYVLAAVAAAVTVSSQLRRKALQSIEALIQKYPIVLKKTPINLDLHRYVGNQDFFYFKKANGSLELWSDS